MASSKIEVHVTEVVTTTSSLVTSTTNTITTSCFPHTSVIFSPQPKGPLTRSRSSDGSMVKSTFMKSKISPDKPIAETNSMNPSVPNIINLNTVENVYEWIKAGGVYVGRKIDNEHFKHDGSKWENRHTIREHKCRKKVIDLFRADIMKNDELRKEIGELKGKVLGCWCSPEECHAQVLHELAGNTPIYEYNESFDTIPGKFMTVDTSNQPISYVSSTSPQPISNVSSTSPQSHHDEAESTNVMTNGNFTLETETSESANTPPPPSLSPSYLPKYDLSDVVDSLRSLQADNLLQKGRILNLEKRITHLEGTLMQNNARLTVRDHVVEALRGEVNRLQQFTRRYCVAVTGIDKQKGENPETLREKVLDLVKDVKSTTNEQDIDKFHRNGPITNVNEQEIIIRFKSHAAKEAFYRARKDLPPARKEVRIKPSLSQNQKNLLRDAQSFIEQPDIMDNDVNPVEFVFANLHGEIQMKLKHKFRGSLFVTFNSVQDLARKLQKVQTVKDAAATFDEISSWADANLESPQVKPKFPPQPNVDDDMGFENFV